MMEANNNVVVISSANPGAGKSFISSNMAVLMAAMDDNKVLLVDTDMRKGYLHDVFGADFEHGLSSILSGESTLEQSVFKTSTEGLHLLPRGKNVVNPSELLMGSAFAQIIEHVSKDYDLVILDSPPVLAVTDPVIIGKHAGT